MSFRIWKKIKRYSEWGAHNFKICTVDQVQGLISSRTLALLVYSKSCVKLAIYPTICYFLVIFSHPLKVNKPQFATTIYILYLFSICIIFIFYLYFTPGSCSPVFGHWFSQGLPPAQDLLQCGHQVSWIWPIQGREVCCGAQQGGSTLFDQRVAGPGAAQFQQRLRKFNFFFSISFHVRFSIQVFFSTLTGWNSSILVSKRFYRRIK